MAGAGVPMRTLQEWMGHRDHTTTAIYADYQPSEREREWVEAAFARGPVVPRGVPRDRPAGAPPTTKAPPKQGFPRSGASGTRTRDLLGAISRAQAESR
jgi:hypothetical protein